MGTGMISQESIMKALDWAYDKALDPGVNGIQSVEDLVKDYQAHGGSREQQMKSLVNWQVTKCATSGFVTGLPGGFALLVAIPANISSVLYVQVRMIAAIAAMNGYDVRSDQVKSLVYACLAGNEVKDVLKQAGIRIGVRFSKQMVGKISFALIKKINQAVGFRLLTKFGSKGLINIGKLVPVVGGVIGGVFDGVTSKLIGNVAISMFAADESAAAAFDGAAVGEPA